MKSYRLGPLPPDLSRLRDAAETRVAHLPPVVVDPHDPAYQRKVASIRDFILEYLGETLPTTRPAAPVHSAMAGEDTRQAADDEQERRQLREVMSAGADTQAQYIQTAAIDSVAALSSAFAPWRRVPPENEPVDEDKVEGLSSSGGSMGGGSTDKPPPGGKGGQQRGKQPGD